MSETTLRLDKWLWHARFFKTRTLATQVCVGGRVRINGQVVSKAHAALRPGDVLTFPQGTRIRVIKVQGLSVRRGPASEAAALYEDLAPPEPRSETPPAAAFAERDPGSGRPTKAERRAIERLQRPS
jgi:ribosome-associated heat shock protein Hsp15